MREIRYRWFCCLAATLIMILALVPNLSAKSPEVGLQGNAKNVAVEYQNTLLSVDAQKTTLLTVFQAIADETQYEFVVPEELLQREVTLSCSKLDLDKAVKRVLDASGVRNYALVSGVKEADIGSKSFRQIEVVLLSPAPESVGGARSGEEVRVKRLKSNAQSSVSEQSAVRSHDEGGSPASGSAGGMDTGPVPVTRPLTPEDEASLMPDGKQGGSGEVPGPGSMSKDVPQPGPVSEDVPQPGPVSTDLP